MKAVICIALLLACTFATETTGPADLLLDHLSGIESDLLTEQFDHDALYASETDKCNDEINARSQAVSDGEDALRTAQDHYARCEGAFHEASADLAQVIAYQAEINSNLQGLAIRRDQEHAEFLVSVEQLDNAITAVDGAFAILAQFTSGGVSFAQVTKNMGAAFKTLVKSGKGSLMAVPLTALLQVSQSGFDEATLQQVKTAFTNLQTDLNNAKVQALQIEQNRTATYDATVTELNGILDKLATSNADLMAYVAEMQACQVQEDAVITSATSKIANNKQALGYATQMCAAFTTEYENATAGRTAERDLLSQLKDFINQQAEVFGDYGVESQNIFQQFQNEQAAQTASQVNAFLQVRQQKNAEHKQRMNRALKSPKHNLRRNK